MILISPSFDSEAAIPRKFTCDGGGINPELQIQNVPPDAKSLALIVHDPDAPMEGGFYHWVVWNIDPATMVIKEESVPPGAVEGNNSADEPGWVAPCPPTGSHHYHFKLYALDTELDLDEGSTAQQLMNALESHVIEEAELIGMYERGRII